MYNALLHLSWSTLWIYHSLGLLNGARIGPLLYRWWSEGIILKFSFLRLLIATQLDEQDDNDGNHDEDDDRHNDDFEKKTHETHLGRSLGVWIEMSQTTAERQC